MAFAPHQQRVVDEKARLDENIPKLSAFIEEGEIFPTLDGAEQERMRTQLSLMGQLSVVLGERIDNFPQP